MSIYLRKDGRYVVKFKDGNAWKQKTFRKTLKVSKGVSNMTKLKIPV